MIKRIICLVLPVLFLIIGAAFAQRPELKGKKELLLQGMFTATEDTKMINTNVGIGYFVDNGFQIGPTFGGGFTFGDLDSYNGNVGLFMKYYFPGKSKTVPYGSVSGGAYFQKTSMNMPSFDLGGLDLGESVSTSSTSTNTMVSLGVGIKHFISERTSFYVQMEAQSVFAKEGSQTMTYGTFGFSALF